MSIWGCVRWEMMDGEVQRQGVVYDASIMYFDVVYRVSAIVVYEVVGIIDVELFKFHAVDKYGCIPLVPCIPGCLGVFVAGVFVTIGCVIVAVHRFQCAGVFVEMECQCYIAIQFAFPRGVLEGVVWVAVVFASTVQ